MTEPLWDFARRIYARDGVAPLCLRLQDEHDLDVDVLLACLWLAARGQPIDDARLDALLAAAAPVRAKIQAIRSLRRSVGTARDEQPDWAPVYEQLLAAELAAERVELQRLEASASATPSPSPAPPSPPRALAAEALRRYARRCRALSCDALLTTLVDHALPTSPAADRD